jgi:hypothetical protein
VRDVTIKIDKNVPRPEKLWWRKYPFAQMKVGDSFFIPGKLQATVSASAYSFARRRGDGRKFSTANVVHKGVEGVRVWRLK